jgi:Cu(I)-responsive transcriptional regulator
MTTRATIGEAARLTGLTAKRIRHYESLGLLPKARRTESGYRLYDDDALHTLRFVAHARELGFGMDEIAELVGLWRNRRRSSAEVKRLVARHVEALRRRAAELARLERALEALAARCHGDERPACPILDALEDAAAPADPPRNGSRF